MKAQPKEIQRYVEPNGKIPFTQWLNSLRDLKTQAKIRRRLDRLKKSRQTQLNPEILDECWLKST